MKCQKTYTVRVYECTPDTKLDLSTILNYMQDIAAEHTVELKITIPELLKKGLTWMLSRYHINVNRYPYYKENVIVKSWVAEHEGMFSIRDYSMETEQGEILAKMTSSWVLYDIKQRKPVPVTTLDLKDVVHPERAIDDSFPRLSLPESPQYSTDMQMRKSDIDINRHVNNRITIEWALEPVPDEIRQGYDLKDAQITFKGQAFLGDPIRSDVELIDNQEQIFGRHHITNSDTGQSITIVNTTWRKKIS
jgi:acyl-ACP thioesterase